MTPFQNVYRDNAAGDPAGVSSMHCHQLRLAAGFSIFMSVPPG
jgi:hypothetical protein